jgi:hypothetical protein
MVVNLNFVVQLKLLLRVGVGEYKSVHTLTLSPTPFKNRLDAKNVSLETLFKTKSRPDASAVCVLNAYQLRFKSVSTQNIYAWFLAIEPSAVIYNCVLVYYVVVDRIRR